MINYNIDHTDDMIKIMHAVSVMDRAGQETFIMNMYRSINREKIQFGFQCTVNKTGDYDNEIKALGGEIFYLKKSKWKTPIFKYLGEIKAHYDFFKQHSDYEVYHIHTYHAFGAWIGIMGAKLAGVNKIFLHSHNTFGMHPMLHKIFRMLINRMDIEKLACSIKAAEWMYGKRAINRQETHVINNGIFPQRFRYDEKQRIDKRNKLGLKNKLVIGHIGRFNIQKNHRFLIDIFADIRKQRDDAVLILIGTGELQDEIKCKVRALGLDDSVYFLGVRTDVNELFHAMDLFLFPSLYEGLSVVAIEAQAAGIQLLAADTLTPETKITECLHFMSLEETSEAWAREAISIAQKGHINTEVQIRAAGYDMKEEAHILENMYLSV